MKSRWRMTRSIYRVVTGDDDKEAKVAKEPEADDDSKEPTRRILK